jgi:hypothetical protein
LIAAVGISSALELLQCSTLDEAAARLQPFLAMRRNAGKQVNTDALTTRNRNPIPDAVMVRALTETMSPSDQLRFRALTPLPRYPRNNGEYADEDLPMNAVGDAPGSSGNAGQLASVSRWGYGTSA